MGELDKLGALAREALLKAREAPASVEQRRRIEQLLEGERQPARMSPDVIRSVRAVEILERIALPQAQRLLRDLAQGDPFARLTMEASAALQRLDRSATAPRP